MKKIEHIENKNKNKKMEKRKPNEIRIGAFLELHKYYMYIGSKSSIKNCPFIIITLNLNIYIPIESKY